jgi:hypothetical protein
MADKDNRKDVDARLEETTAVRQLAIARAEIADLKRALVEMCDVYSANRNEKLRVKAFRRHAADADRPFSLADVGKTFDALAADEAVIRRPPRGTR